MTPINPKRGRSADAVAPTLVSVETAIDNRDPTVIPTAASLAAKSAVFAADLRLPWRFRALSSADRSLASHRSRRPQPRSLNPPPERRTVY